MAVPELRRPLPAWLRARLAVLAAMSGTAVILLLLGRGMSIAVPVSLAAVVGGAEISTQLTRPLPALRIRVVVIVVILVLVTVLIGAGQQPVLAVTATLAIAGASAGAARRAVGEPQAPGLTP